jgi:hypothetical protein
LKSRLAVFYWNVRRSWEAGVILDRPTRGMLQGLWDFYRHRFGDCPSSIRRLDAAHRGQTYVPSSANTGHKSAAQISESSSGR